MRWSFRNKVSFVLVVLTLQIPILSHSVDAQELNFRSLLKKFRKNDSPKLDGLLKSVGEKTTGLLDNFLPTNQQAEGGDAGFDFSGTLEKAGNFLSGIRERIFSGSSSLSELLSPSKKQNSPCDTETTTEAEATHVEEQLGGSRSEDDLFSDLEPPEDVTEMPSSKIETGLYSVSRDTKNDRASVIVSVLKDLKLMFSIPIKVIHTKYTPQIVNNEQNCELSDYCLET